MRYIKITEFIFFEFFNIILIIFNSPIYIKYNILFLLIRIKQLVNI